MLTFQKIHGMLVADLTIRWSYLWPRHLRLECQLLAYSHWEYAMFKCVFSDISEGITPALLLFLICFSLSICPCFWTPPLHALPKHNETKGSQGELQSRALPCARPSPLKNVLFLNCLRSWVWGKLKPQSQKTGHRPPRKKFYFNPHDSVWEVWRYAKRAGWLILERDLEAKGSLHQRKTSE